MGQEDGEKWTAAANLQLTISKSGRLLANRPPPLQRLLRAYSALRCANRTTVTPARAWRTEGITSTQLS